MCGGNLTGWVNHGKFISIAAFVHFGYSMGRPAKNAGWQPALRGCAREFRREKIHSVAQGCDSFGCAKIAASMKPIAEILGPALRRAGRRGSAMSWLTGAWPVIVGAKLGEGARPARVATGGV